MPFFLLLVSLQCKTCMTILLNPHPATLSTSQTHCADWNTFFPFLSCLRHSKRISRLPNVSSVSVSHLTPGSWHVFFYHLCTFMVVTFSFFLSEPFYPTSYKKKCNARFYQVMESINRIWMLFFVQSLLRWVCSAILYIIFFPQKFQNASFFLLASIEKHHSCLRRIVTEATAEKTLSVSLLACLCRVWPLLSLAESVNATHPQHPLGWCTIQMCNFMISHTNWTHISQQVLSHHLGPPRFIMHAITLWTNTCRSKCVKS